MTHRFRKVVTAVAISLVAVSALPAARLAAQGRFEDDRDRDRDREDRGDRGDRGSPGDRVELDSFYEALEPHGRWFQHAQYGYVWSPDVHRNWRPYTRGKWQFTEEHGWYWQAEEPWGWAVFHYGRWFLDDDSGWVWVPGTEWSPAWVAWRNSDETVGWAPLPPEAEWRGSGLSFSESYYDSPRFNVAWCFAPVAVLAGYSVYRYLHPASRNYAYVNQTRWVASHSFVNRRIYNAGFDRGRYQQVTGRQITPLRIVSATAPNQHGRLAAPGAVQIYRPSMSRTAVAAPPPRVVDQPQRDWRHGRPGVPNQPFQRPFGGAPAQQQQQQQPAQPGGFIRPGQRPPIAPQAQQPAAQQPAAQQPAPSWNRQARPPIAPTPQVQQAPVQPAPTARPVPAQAPQQARPAQQPQQPAARPAQPPQQQAQPPQGGNRPQGAATPDGNRPQGGPPGQGKGDGKGDPQKKRPPPQDQQKQ